MSALIDRVMDTTNGTLEVSNEYGHFNRRVLSHGDIKRYLARESTGSLPCWDQWWYEIAYYIATPSKAPYTAHPQTWTGFVNGEWAVRDMTGDVLCGKCAATMVATDELVYVAYKFNGEIGDTEEIYCCHCGEVIYSPNID